MIESPRARRREFRPQVGDARLEDRVALSTAAVVGPVAGGIHATAAPSFRTIGHNTSGLWKLGNSGQKVAIFAVEVNGTFDANTARSAWQYGINNVAKKSLSLDTTDAAGTRRTTGKYYEVVGWYNPKTDKGGWMAVRFDGWYPKAVTSGPWWNRKTKIVEHLELKVITNYSTTPRTVDDGFTATWNSDNTRGYRIDFVATPVNKSGDVRLTFTRPY